MAHGSIYVVVRVSRELEDERGAPAPSSIVIVHPPGAGAVARRETGARNIKRPSIKTTGYTLHSRLWLYTVHVPCDINVNTRAPCVSSRPRTRAAHRTHFPLKTRSAASTTRQGVRHGPSGVAEPDQPGQRLAAEAWRASVGDPPAIPPVGAPLLVKARGSTVKAAPWKAAALPSLAWAAAPLPRPAWAPLPSALPRGSAQATVPTPRAYGC